MIQQWRTDEESGHEESRENKINAATINTTATVLSIYPDSEPYLTWSYEHDWHIWITYRFYATILVWLLSYTVIIARNAITIIEFASMSHEVIFFIEKWLKLICD